MIFWILLAICVIVALCCAAGGVDEAFEWYGAIGLGIGGFVLGGAVSAFVAGLVYVPLAYWADNYAHINGSDSVNLKAIKMGSQTTGNFFLGSGVVDGENVYTYYYVNDNGNYQSGRLDADDAEVVESDTETPRIVTHHWKMPWWYGPMDMTETYTIYVPENSIVSNYNLDLP